MSVIACLRVQLRAAVCKWATVHDFVSPAGVPLFLTEKSITDSFNGWIHEFGEEEENAEFGFAAGSDGLAECAEQVGDAAKEADEAIVLALTSERTQRLGAMHGGAESLDAGVLCLCL